ncbi:unnamed protein product [Leuciscus chuanchicus]
MTIAETLFGIFVIRQEGAEPGDDPADVGIVLEGVEVMSELGNVAFAVVMLLGLVYALNLSYPQELKYTFEVLQKIIMELDGNKLSNKGQHILDEVMVAYKGTRAGSLRQYIANKPDKWGFKLFCRASSSGIIHDFLLYQGASTFFNGALTEQEEALLPGAKLVTTFCKTITLPRLSIVFCDNFFTSFDLVQNLQENLGIR